MKKILCLDVGEKRIGVAVSDWLGLLAQPVETVVRKSTADAMERIAFLIRRDAVEKIVVGLPKNMDGSEGFQAESTRKFVGRLLESVPNVEVIYWDERLTSKMARQSLSHMKIEKAKEKKLIDTVAAVHILQSYLDAKR